MHDSLFWEKAVDGAIVTDQAGHVLWVNPAAATIFGWGRPRDMLQVHLTALVVEEEKNELEDDLDALRGNQHVFRICRFLDRRGKTFDTTMEAVQIEGDCLFLTVRNPRTNPTPALTQDTPVMPTDYMPKAVRKVLADPHDEGPAIRITQKGRIRMHGDTGGNSDNLLPFTRRILKEFDRVRESIAGIGQTVTRVQALQETTMRDQQRLEDRIFKLESRPDCTSCRANTTIDIVMSKLDTHDVQLRRVEDRIEKHRDWADGRIERSREVPILDRRFEEISKQNVQTWMFVKSKWGYIAGAIGMIGILAAIITILSAIL